MSLHLEQEARQLSALVIYLRELIAALEAECLASVSDAALLRMLVKMKLELDDATLRLSLLREQRA